MLLHWHEDFGSSSGDIAAHGWRRVIEPQSAVEAAVSADEFASFIEDPCPPDADSTEASLRTMHLKAATEQAIQYMDRELAQRDIIVRFDRYPRTHTTRGGLSPVHGFEARYAVLPRVPIHTFDRVDTVDEDGNVSTIDAADYDVDETSEPARLHIHDVPYRGSLAYFAGIRVYYTAGYESGEIPEQIRLGILRHAAMLYDRRGQDAGRALTMSGAADLYEPYRVRTGL